MTNTWQENNYHWKKNTPKQEWSNIKKITTVAVLLATLAGGVFGITKSNGEFDGDYVWRYVPNERIDYLKLEKIIFDRTSITNKDKIKDNYDKIEEMNNNTEKTKWNKKYFRFCLW